MKGLRSIPRVLKINGIDNRVISLLFNNGYSKKINIEELLSKDNGVKEGSLSQKILSSDEIFNSVQILDTTIGWPTIGKYVAAFGSEPIFCPYDIDPLLLYNSGELDDRFNLNLGDKIRSLRKRIGLTQEELANRVGTSKYYISRLENNKSDIELLTLKKIVEAGLNGRLHLNIEL